MNARFRRREPGNVSARFVTEDVPVSGEIRRREPGNVSARFRVRNAGGGA